jgi:protein-arginine kinase activator protein McsA
MRKCPECKENRACIVSGQRTNNDIREGLFVCTLCGHQYWRPLHGASVRSINRQWRDYQRRNREKGN